MSVLKPSRAVAAARKEYLAARAWEMRRWPTDTELYLWRELRGSRMGVPFRRQVVLGGRYIVDFAARSIRLVIEVDGGYHSRRRLADERRDRNLQRLGYHVVHIPSDLVRKNRASAVALVREGIAQRER